MPMSSLFVFLQIPRRSLATHRPYLRDIRMALEDFFDTVLL